MEFTRTNFSESPLHLLTIEEAEILKKVVLHSVATALASIVLPVPEMNFSHTLRAILSYRLSMCRDGADARIT